MYGYSPAVASYFDAHEPKDRTGHPANLSYERGRVVRLDRSLGLTAVGRELLHLPYPLDAGLPFTGDWVWVGPSGRPPDHRDHPAPV
jgi:ribosome biogenesis GTPase